MDMQRFNVTHPANLFLAVSAGVVGTIGLPGALVLLTLILSKYKKRKPHEWLLFFLALGDFLFCLNNAFLESLVIVHFDRVECKVAGALNYLFSIITVITPTLVAFNRYLSMYNPTLCSRVFTNRNVFLMCLCSTLCSAGIIAQFAIDSDSLGQDDLGICGVRVTSVSLAALTVSTCWCVILNYVLLFYFCYKVVKKIRNHKNRIGQHSRVPTRLVNESRELVTVMLVITILPLFTQMPCLSIKLLQVFTEPFEPWVSRTMTAPFTITPASNAYITLYVVKNYRKIVIRFLKKCRRSTNVATPVNEQYLRIALWKK